MTDRRRFDSLPPATQAGIISNDPRFQQFVAWRMGFSDGARVTPSSAAEYIRRQCGVTSRANLEGPTAEKFAALRTDFDAWAGKLATPKEGQPT